VFFAGDASGKAAAHRISDDPRLLCCIAVRKPRYHRNGLDLVSLERTFLVTSSKE
jgi:hypothetical protein